MTSSKSFVQNVVCREGAACGAARDHSDVPWRRPRTIPGKSIQVHERHAGCRQREIWVGNCSKIFVRQLSDDYDVEKCSFLSSPDITRALVDNIIRMLYANGKVKELKKPQVPLAAGAPAPRDPNALTVGGFQRAWRSTEGWRWLPRRGSWAAAAVGRRGGGQQQWDHGGGD